MLILKACQKMQDVREKVMDVLGDAPKLLEEMECFISLYPNDQKLNAKVHRLYVALLLSIEGIVEWLGHRICR